MSTTPRIRVVLADDHQLFRHGLRQLIETEPDIEVVAEAANGLEALQALAAHAPQVLLLDLAMPLLDGLSTLAAARRAHPDVSILVLTMHGEETTVLRALAGGAHGFMRKDADSSEVIGAIRALVEGRSWIEPRAAAVLLEDYRRLHTTIATPGASVLSDRDVTLLRLLATGRGNKEIALILGLAESTIKNQLGSLFSRIGVSDRTQAALYAFAHGILITEPRSADDDEGRETS
jgi:DNA-binding NarL/FixJ family response regulator